MQITWHTKSANSLLPSHLSCFSQAWEESDPRYITNSDEVRLRSFTTKVHKVDASVTYKADC